MHPLTWFVWLGGTLVAVSLTRNPLYLVLMLAEFALVATSTQDAHTENSAYAPLPLNPLRFALFVVPLAAVFNGLTAHFGETILFTLPPQIPLLGGAITAEALIYGAINGLVLSALFSAFLVLNHAVPVRDLIRFIPRALYPVAVVVSIAVTFVPTTLRQLQQIREAQAVRGHQVRGVRDWLPLFMPLLVGGMERALQLAEAMTARGFASEAPPQKATSARAQAFVVLGLILLLAGMLWTLQGNQGVSLILLGSLALMWAFRMLGQNVSHTTYRQAAWQAVDSLTVAGVVLALGVFLWLGRASRVYEPYPVLTWPVFDPLVGVGLLGFLVPGFMQVRTTKVLPKTQVE